MKSFHIVFEAMIDELIGDSDIPRGLKEQEDGKLIDHFYTYAGLLVDDKADDDKNFYIVPVDLGEDPSAPLEAERAVKGRVESPDSIGKFLFGVVTKQRRAKDGRQELTKEYMAFHNHEATEFVMRNMPGGDITTVRYFVPMFDGGIGGYYEIKGMTFGARKQPVLDEEGAPVTDANGEEIAVKMPCLNIRLGAYTSLGEQTAAVPNLRNWNGQIHSYPEVLELFRNAL